MWDVDFQTAVAQAEMEDRPTAGAYHRCVPPGRGRRHRDRHDAPGAAGGLRGRRRPPRRRPLVGPGRHRGHPPLFGVEVPVLTHLGRPRQGDRRRHDLHLRRRHRRRVVARARPPHPLDRPARRAAPRPSGRRGCRGGRPGGSAGRQEPGPAGAGRNCWPPPASWSAIPARSSTRSSTTSEAIGRSRS